MTARLPGPLTVERVILPWINIRSLLMHSIHVGSLVLPSQLFTELLVLDLEPVQHVILDDELRSACRTVNLLKIEGALVVHALNAHGANAGLQDLLLR